MQKTYDEVEGYEEEVEKQNEIIKNLEGNQTNKEEINAKNMEIKILRIENLEL